MSQLPAVEIVSGCRIPRRSKRLRVGRISTLQVYLAILGFCVLICLWKLLSVSIDRNVLEFQQFIQRFSVSLHCNCHLLHPAVISRSAMFAPEL